MEICDPAEPVLQFPINRIRLDPIRLKKDTLHPFPWNLPLLQSVGRMLCQSVVHALNTPFILKSQSYSILPYREHPHNLSPPTIPVAESPIGRHVAAHIDVHGVIGVLQMVGPLEIDSHERVTRGQSQGLPRNSQV